MEANMSKPKFKINDWVCCTQHGTEFRIECIKATDSNPKLFLYYQNKHPEKACGIGKYHIGNWIGVPEHLLKLISRGEK